MLYIWRSHLWTHLGIAATMPTTKAELERLVEELQQKLEKAQQSKESIEAAVQATMTSQFEHTNVVQQQLEAMQKTIDGLQSETELAVIQAKDALREDLTRIHHQDLKMKELAHLQIEWGEERLWALEFQPGSWLIVHIHSCICVQNAYPLMHNNVKGHICVNCD